MIGPRPQCYIPSHKLMGPLVLEKKIFEGFLPYMGVAAILVMWPRPCEQTFVPPSHWGSIWNLALIGPAVLEKKIFDQRTSGPVNAHLTPGPGIYLNAFIHIYSPRAGADNSLGTNVDVNRKPLSLCQIRGKFKKRNLILYTFLMILYMYTVPGQGQKTPWGQTFDVNRKPLSLCPLVAGLKKTALKSDFIYIFLCFTNNPLGTKFWWQQTGFFFLPICCRFQNDLFEIWFYTHF